MHQNQAEDWIEYIIDKVYTNYRGRQIVLWGKYAVSDEIRDKLKERYGIDTALYIDNDIRKTDGKKVFSPDYLYGKSNKYYIVVPLAYYQSIKEKLIRGGYSQNVDYYYFCDCILRQEPEYYEDAHGNKIIGEYTGLKFAFSGFHSVIKVGNEVQFGNSNFYIHSHSEIVVGDYVKFQGVNLNIYDEAEVIVGTKIRFQNVRLHISRFAKAIFCREICLKEADIFMKEKAKLEIWNECKMMRVSIRMQENAEILLEEYVNILADIQNAGNRTNWQIGTEAKLKVGSRGWFGPYVGCCFLGENTSLIVGREFSINGNYRIILGKDTGVCIGDDCMFSYDISMRSNDGHSIFDIQTEKNVNSFQGSDRKRRIVIGSHVWIGERSEILYNTEIGNGSIIGAMSLVKGKIPNNCIAAGIPARIIKRNVAWCREEGADCIIKCGKEYIHNTE